jgi:sortase A
LAYGSEENSAGMKWLKKHLSTLILILVFAAGLSLLLYPSVSDYWNARHQSKAIASYAETVSEIDNSSYQQMWDDAVAYNQQLANSEFNLEPDDEQLAAYEKQLDVTGTGIMGYVEIPKINCKLPIYHGTDASILQIAIGHLPGTSLPVGGEGTHCVISGHRGLPSAKLFTNLDKMKVGDTFMLHTLDETLTYEVDQILIVLPDETDALRIEAGQDLCTLMTCTPYGVNDHRLLVRGHRVPNGDSTSERVSADAMQIDHMSVAVAIMVPILVALLIVALVSGSKKRRGGMDERDE